MDWAGWALFGLMATAALTAVMIAAQLAGLTRLDLPLVLGTLVTEDPDRARVAGFFIHLTVGQGFALGYAAAFALLDRATWWLGALLRAPPRRGRPHRARSPARRDPSPHGLAPRRSRQHGCAGTPRPVRPQLRAADPRSSRSSLTSSTGSFSACSSRPADVGNERPLGAGIVTPIEDYGLLGDTRTAALVSSDGAIDWLCVPRFDADPIFGRLVGGPAAGTFRIAPARPATIATRGYRRHSATLETTWTVGERRLTLTEAMVAEVAGRLLPATLLVRRLVAEGGPVDVVVDFDPRLGEHHRAPATRRRGRNLVCTWGPLAVSLGCAPDHGIDVGRPAPVTVTPDQPAHTRPRRRPPRTAHPRRPRSRLGPRHRRRSALAARGPPRSTRTCPTATPSCAAC